MVGLVVSDITVIYKNGHLALHDASFDLPEGSITALVGVNGSGKSTLFKSIMGFVSLNKGEVRILGHSVKKALKSNLVAYVPQNEEIDWNFPVLVKDVVMMGRYGHMNFLKIPKKIDLEKVSNALDKVDMSSYANSQIGELSGGQKKRVFIARALAQESRVVLLDEPFTGVDVKTEEQIMLLLKDMRSEGKIILVSTHNLGSVPEFCDRSVLINKTVLAQGTTKEIYTQENLQLTFGGVLRRFVLTGKELHDDDDTREVTILSDDERPVVIYGETENNDNKND
ncbi:manganese/iron ABC transporter ATP-binding protein [SAR86 cluster bacterium]|nr:manganese/iron ABC transporter ATP-binding protein [SAR86 cluster bacterium]